MKTSVQNKHEHICKLFCLTSQFLVQLGLTFQLKVLKTFTLFYYRYKHLAYKYNSS